MDAGARADGPDPVPEAAERSPVERAPVAAPGTAAPAAHAEIARALAAGESTSPAALGRLDPAARAAAVHGLQRGHGNQAVVARAGGARERGRSRGGARRRRPAGRGRRGRRGRAGGRAPRR